MSEAIKKIAGKKGYVYLFLKLAIFLVIAFVLDFTIGKILSHFYFKQSSGWEYRTKYSIEDTKANILIFGASRAQQQYNPEYFEERLHQTCYNVGRDGEPFFYHYAVFKSILQRYTPKIIVLEVENAAFKKSQDSYDKMTILLPFYKDHPELHSIIELRSEFEKMKLKSSIYPYNSLLFKIAMGNVPSAKRKKEDIKGYVPLDNALDEPLRNVDLSTKYELDSNKVNFYKAFIDDCKKSNIKLFVVCSPYFFNSTGTDLSMELAKNIAHEKGVDFVDMAKDKYFLSNSKLFDDTVHVNVTGAKILTNRLIDTIMAKSAVLPVE